MNNNATTPFQSAIMAIPGAKIFMSIPPEILFTGMLIYWAGAYLYVASKFRDDASSGAHSSALFLGGFIAPIFFVDDIGKIIKRRYTKQ